MNAETIASATVALGAFLALAGCDPVTMEKLSSMPACPSIRRAWAERESIHVSNGLQHVRGTIV